MNDEKFGMLYGSRIYIVRCLKKGENYETA